MSPAERLLGVQTSILLVFAAWAGGGRLPWTPPVMLALALAGLPALWLLRTEGTPVRWLGFLPLALWVLQLGIALLNPSHVSSENGNWVPRPGWIAWLPTTMDRRMTLLAELPWLTALVQAGLITAVGPSRRLMRTLWGLATVNGFVLALVGSAFYFAQADKLLGLVDPPEPSYFFATFFYKNHWAAYGALSAFAGCGLALDYSRRAAAGQVFALGRALLFGAIALLTALTLPLPGSRAGALLAAVIVLSFFALLAARSWRVSGRTLFRRGVFAAGFAVVALAIIGYGGNLYWRRGLEDVARTKYQLEEIRRGGPGELRFQLSRDTLRMAAARPWFGWGLGSFGSVFPRYQGNYLRDAHGRPTARFEYAHNDWLQLAAETGFVGLGLLVIPAALAGWRIWRAGGLLGRWGLAGCTIIAGYAWTDFPLNNPAVLILWTVLLVSLAEAARPAPPGDPFLSRRQRPRPVQPSVDEVASLPWA